MTQSPIFLQALWRTGSTYLWSKFRAHPELRCYNEPLHGRLADLTQAEIESNEDEARKSRMLRHPKQSAHCFAEYPINDAGVLGYLPRFEAENYHLKPGKKDAELSAYIQGLMDHARERRQRPLFQPNRASLRGQWLAKNFPGVHVYLNRAFEDVFKSYYSYHGPYSFYLKGYANILAKNAQDPLFTEAAQWAAATSPAKGGRAFCRDLTAFFWSLALVEASQYAQLIVDFESLGDPATARKLSFLTGVELDFSDFKKPPAGKPEDRKISDEMKGIIARAAEKISPDWKAIPQMEALFKEEAGVTSSPNPKGRIPPRPLFLR